MFRCPMLTIILAQKTDDRPVVIGEFYSFFAGKCGRFVATPAVRMQFCKAIEKIVARWLAILGVKVVGCPGSILRRRGRGCCLC